MCEQIRNAHQLWQDTIPADVRDLVAEYLRLWRRSKERERACSGQNQTVTRVPSLVLPLHQDAIINAAHLYIETLLRITSVTIKNQFLLGLLVGSSISDQPRIGSDVDLWFITDSRQDSQRIQHDSRRYMRLASGWAERQTGLMFDPCEVALRCGSVDSVTMLPWSVQPHVVLREFSFSEGDYSRAIDEEISVTRAQRSVFERDISNLKRLIAN